MKYQSLIAELVAALETVEPVKLKGLNMLKSIDPSPGEWVPQVATPQFLTMAEEYLEYRANVMTFVGLIINVQPIAWLNEDDVLEYGL